MKTLLLLRHAKSDWGDSSLRDFDRPLAPRGERDAPQHSLLTKPYLTKLSTARRRLS